MGGIGACIIEYAIQIGVQKPKNKGNLVYF